MKDQNKMTNDAIDADKAAVTQKDAPQKQYEKMQIPLKAPVGGPYAPRPDKDISP
jgi:hypothetical protein